MRSIVSVPARRFRSRAVLQLENLALRPFAALERDEINARELYLLLEGIEVVRERRRYTRFPINE